MPAKVLAAFIDTNVLVYTLSEDVAKAAIAEALIARGGTISVQVLNELTNVIRRKTSLSWDEAETVLTTMRALLTVKPLTIETHVEGLRQARRYSLSIYDAMIVASALEAGCDTLMSEDMQDGMLVDGRLRIRNPFR